MAYFQKRYLKRTQTTHWLARVRLAGFPHFHATFENLKLAKAWASKKEAELRSGKYNAENPAAKYTAAQMIVRYLDTVLETKTTKRRFKDKQRAQLLWWQQNIGHYTLANLTPFVLAEQKEKLAGANFSRRKPATVNRYLAALNHVINTAIKEWGWLDKNPLMLVHKPKEPRGRTRFLSDKERDALLAAAILETQRSKKPVFLIILFAICTGARKGEILGLKLKDIDLPRASCVVYETKNGEPRQLHLSAQLLPALQDYLATRLNPRSEYLFATRTTRNQLCIEHEWRRVMSAAGVRNFRFHDLRHSFASYLAMNGASLTEIAEALGHKSLGLVKRYAHMTQTHTAQVVASMNNKILNPKLKDTAA